MIIDDGFSIIGDNDHLLDLRKLMWRMKRSRNINVANGWCSDRMLLVSPRINGRWSIEETKEFSR